MANAESGSNAEKLHAQAERIVGQEVPEATPENRGAVEERLAEVNELHDRINPLRDAETDRVAEGIDAARETIRGGEAGEQPSPERAGGPDDRAEAPDNETVSSRTLQINRELAEHEDLFTGPAIWNGEPVEVRKYRGATPATGEVFEVWKEGWDLLKDSNRVAPLSELEFPPEAREAMESAGFDLKKYEIRFREERGEPGPEARPADQAREESASEAGGEPDWDRPVNENGPDFNLPDDPFAGEFTDQPPRVAAELRKQANEWLQELRANVALDQVRQAEERWNGGWTEAERIARENDALDNRLPDVTPDLVEEARRLVKEENDAFAESPLDRKLLEQARERKFEVIQGMADEYAEGRTPTVDEYKRANEAYLSLVRDGGKQPTRLDIDAEIRKYAINRFETLKNRFWKGSKLKKIAVIGAAAASILVPPIGALAVSALSMGALYETGRFGVMGTAGGLKRLRHRGEKLWSDRKLRKFLGGGKAAKSVDDERRPI